MPVLIGRYRSTLRNPVAIADPSIQVASTDGLPTLGAGDYYYLSLVSTDINNIEVVKVTGRNGDTLTVERGQSGTTPGTWPIGSPIVLSDDPITLKEYIEEFGGTGHIAPFARNDESWGDLDELGISDVDDTARLVMQRSGETEVKHMSFGQFSAKIEDGIVIPDGGISAQTATDIANTRIAALRPNPFTNPEKTKLAGIEAGATGDQDAAEVPTSTTAFGNRLSSSDSTVQKALDTLDDIALPKSHAAVGGDKTPAYDVEFPDKAPDGTRAIKDIVGEFRTPATADATFQGGAPHSSERIWVAEFTVEGESILVEYRPNSATSGTGDHPGQFVLQGPDNFLTGFFGGRGAIAKVIIKSGANPAFTSAVTDEYAGTPFDDPRRRDIRSVTSHGSDPAGFTAPVDQTTTPGSPWTLDFEFVDGTNFYDGELQPRTVDVFRPADVKEYARTGQRKVAATDLQTKPEEAVNAFEGDAWTATGGVTLLQAARFTAGNIASATFVQSRTQGPHLANNYIGIRIPIADKDDLANHRLYIGENDGEDYHTVYPGTGWTHIRDSGAWAYYQQQVTDHPAGDWFGVQGFTTLRLDDEAGAATVNAVLIAGTGLSKVSTDTTVTLNVDADAGGVDAAAVKAAIDTDVKEYARTGERKIEATDLNTKGEEIVEAFEGAGWTVSGGVSSSAAAAPTSSNIAGLTYQDTRTQSPRAENAYVAARILLAQKTSLAEWRLVVGEDISDSYRANYPASGWTHVTDDATYAYYVQLVTDIPVGDEYGLQTLDRLRLDDESGAATVAAVLEAGTGLLKAVSDTSVTLSVAGGGAGLSTVTSDTSLKGTGASTDPLGVADDAIGTAQLAAGAVTGAKVAARTLTQETIANSAIGSLQIATGAIGAQELQDAAVDTASVQNDAITEPKLSAAVRTKLNAVGGGGGASGGAYLETEILTDQAITTGAFVASTVTVDADADAFSVTITTGASTVYDTFSREEFDALPPKTASTATRDEADAIRINGAWIARTATNQILASAEGAARSISVTSYEFEDAENIVLRDDVVTPPMLDADTDAKKALFRNRIAVPTYNNPAQLGNDKPLSSLTNPRAAIIGDTIPDREDKTEDWITVGSGGSLLYRLSATGYKLEFFPATASVAARRNQVFLTVTGETTVTEHVLYVNDREIAMAQDPQDGSGVYKASVASLLAEFPSAKTTAKWNVLSGTQDREWLFVSDATKEIGEATKDEFKRWFEIGNVAEQGIQSSPVLTNIRIQAEYFRANEPLDQVIDWSQHPARPYAQAVLPGDTVVQFFPGNYPISARRNTYIFRVDSNTAARLVPDRARVSVTGSNAFAELTLSSRRVQGPFTYYDCSVAASSQAAYRPAAQSLGFNFFNNTTGEYLWQRRAESDRVYLPWETFAELSGNKAHRVWNMSEALRANFSSTQANAWSSVSLEQVTRGTFLDVSALPDARMMEFRVKIGTRTGLMHSQPFSTTLLKNLTRRNTSLTRSNSPRTEVAEIGLTGGSVNAPGSNERYALRMNFQGQAFLWFGIENSNNRVLMILACDHPDYFATGSVLEAWIWGQ